MNSTLVETFNKHVMPEDVLIHLGDWSFGGIHNIWLFRSQIKCKSIHLILGNHDHHIERNKQLPNYMQAPAKSLFTSVQYVNTFKHEKDSLFLSHYSHRVWEGSHRGVIHLYGHSHASLEDKPYGKSMDVGVDAAYRLFGEYRPFHIDEIKSIMNQREIEFPDHHDSNTN
jgi:calcineurin-like phosphoesterase family protein